MINKIHIFGASGTGTTTLGKAIASEFGYKHLDSDDYFWHPTNPPFTTKRDLQERITFLQNDTNKYKRWVLSGSLTGWGDFLINQFDLVVFLYLPQEIRLERLYKREEQRHGKERIAEGGDMHEIYRAFIDWTIKYDTGNFNIRSLSLHNKWLETITCPILKIENNIEIPEKLEIIKRIII